MKPSFAPLRAITQAALVITLFLVEPALAQRATGDARQRDLSVRLTSGRVLSGSLDTGLGHQGLVLLSGAEGIEIRRTVPWHSIQSVTRDGELVPIAGLRQSAQTATGHSSTAAEANKRVSVHTLAAAAQSTPVASLEPQVRVVTLAMDAWVANWDADVECDGLIVDVAPLDEYGSLAAAGAVAEIELFAPQRRDFSLAPMSGGDTLELVERWTQSIGPSQYGSSGARLRLPFGAIHPELRPDWTASWYGLVHVKLVVPGHGVFENSRDGVRIRPWAPNRDRLELKTGQRFLPSERLGRSE